MGAPSEPWFDYNLKLLQQAMDDHYDIEKDDEVGKQHKEPPDAAGGDSFPQLVSSKPLIDYSEVIEIVTD